MSRLTIAMLARRLGTSPDELESDSRMEGVMPTLVAIGLVAMYVVAFVVRCKS